MGEKNSTFRQEDNQLVYTRFLKAPRELVWEVWTQPEHLKVWWGPDGFTLTNKSMKVAPGSKWSFIMHGLGQDFDNEIQYEEVIKPSLLTYRHGNPANEEMSFKVRVSFEEKDGGTLLTMSSIFKSKEVIEELNRRVNAIESGCQTLNKLDAYVNAQQLLRQQLKTTNMARVSTYLNFSGNTEAAFLFYKSVFGTEFGGGGIKRFGDFPQPEGQPGPSKEDQHLILHIELPILGGHVLMGSDAPESMGFKMNFGNNIHINLEPDTRAETKRLFEALSAGGQVTMDLQDMFWGSYYGSCTDKFGVQWMLNCAAPAK